MKHPKVRWQGRPVIITTNVLPSVMRKPTRMKDEEEYKFLDRWNNYMAFMSRCKLSYMKKSYSNKCKFPYTSLDLARYM